MRRTGNETRRDRIFSIEEHVFRMCKNIIGVRSEKVQR